MDNEGETSAGGKTAAIRDVDAEERLAARAMFRLWVAALILAVFGYRFIMELSFSSNRYWEGYIFAALGGTFTIIAITGILPLLWFAIGARWDHRKHFGPMVLWSVFAAVFCWINYQGEAYLRF
jgi:hypothetical protein